VSARVCELVATIARKGQITLIPPVANEAHRTEADDAQLTQVLTNLVVNAIQATPPNGTVTIRTREVEQTPPPYVGGDVRSWLAIAVEDTGAGMDEATRIRVFEPFYTTKDIGDGTGLGLSVSWGIIREHGGWIDIVSTPGEGSTFTVYIPKGT
jgi:two-component system NtrC family sensor kinase